MEAMAREWTDDRLDALKEKVDIGFKHVDQRFDQMDKRFERIETMQRTINQGLIGLAGVMVTGFIALATLIVATQI